MSKVKSKPLNRFENFRSVIDASQDLDLMKSCQGLLRDTIAMNDMIEQLEKLRANLYADKNRMFFSFFVEDLPPMEIAALADKCSGKVKILEKKAEEQAAKDALNKSDVPQETK